MAKYYITGVWKDTSDTITHYAVHKVDADGRSFGSPVKRTKADAVILVANTSNSVITVMWDYTHGVWVEGESVYVAGTGTGRFLKSNPDKSISDNLGHLICWDNFIA